MVTKSPTSSPHLRRSMPYSRRMESGNGNSGGDDDDDKAMLLNYQAIINKNKYGNNDDDTASSIGRSELDDKSGDGDEGHHQTTYWQTVIHLIKGYIGCGILSLPWAVSQLGIVVGACSIIFMAFWSSYNCWTVVRLKRFIEHSESPAAVTTAATAGGGGNNKSDPEISSAVSSVSSSVATSITYPDVGSWAYGKQFEKYIAICVCAQQLAICTVFLSFIGENLLAVIEFLDMTWFVQTHGAVVSAALPFVLCLSFIPTLRALTPVMAAGSILVFVGFASIGVIGGIEWGNDNVADVDKTLPTFQPTTAPLSLCAILYSFEGICLILPIESAMKEPKQFKSAFTLSLSLVALIMSAMAVLSILAFGQVTNGSITAFLLDTYKDDDRAKILLMFANTVVSLSILLTFPLMLFPAVELVGPMTLKGGSDDGEKEDEDEQSLDGFEPMAPLPEHDVASLESLPSQHHDYGNVDVVAIGADASGKNGGVGDEDDDDLSDDGDNGSRSLSRMSSTVGRSVKEIIFPEMHMPGDSPQLRAGLVFITYAIAMVVPNVEALVSLAGAIAGSSTALLIPPILELAWIKHLEEQFESGTTATVTLTTATLGAVASGGSGDGVKDETTPMVPKSNTTSKKKRNNKYRFAKIKSWFLLTIGTAFSLFGAYSSVKDIVDIYLQ